MANVDIKYGFIVCLNATTAISKFDNKKVIFFKLVTGGQRDLGDKVTGGRSDRGQSDRGQSDRGQSDRGQSDRGQSDRGQNDQGTK
jgi:hypothetical protein